MAVTEPSTTDKTPLLEVEDIHTYYGSIEALKGISLTVYEGEIVTLIGSNGAGKSTTLRSISGLTPPRTGAIRFRGEDLSKTPAQEIVARGISQSPEGRRCFQRMTRGGEPRRSAPTCAATIASPTTSTASTTCSRGSRSASSRRRAPCPAASSRCSPSAGR